MRRRVGFVDFELRNADVRVHGRFCYAEHTGIGQVRCELWIVGNVVYARIERTGRDVRLVRVADG